MKSPITYTLMAGALALAAASPALMAATGDDAATAGTQGNQGTVDYKAEYNKCAKLPGSDTAGCRDAVGMRQATEGDKTGNSLEGVGTPKAQDKCARLSGDAQRECLINDNAGG
jgi:hypothetical protein